MRRLETLEQYRNLINTVRQSCRRPFSNNYFTYDGIERYIRLGRAYYHETAGGVVFLFDEERYFRVCLYLDEKQHFEIPQPEKKLLVRNVYRSGKKDSVINVVEARLQEIGFHNEGTSVQVKGDLQALLQQSRGIERYIRRLEAAGFHYVFADETQMAAFEKMLLDSKIIKDYHIDYKTPEEKCKLKGEYLGIVDTEGRLCAASIMDVDIAHAVSHGKGIAADERYKMGGLIPTMAYYRFRWLMERGIQMCDVWILVDNFRSLQYHESMGYKATDKFADEWIRSATTGKKPSKSNAKLAGA